MLILSLFTGAGLLDQAFREQGFCVVSAGDIIYGQDIRNFHTMVDKFDGVIGGSPCQDFSGLKRNKSDYSQLMLNEYIRVVNEAQPRCGCLLCFHPMGEKVFWLKPLCQLGFLRFFNFYFWIGD